MNQKEQINQIMQKLAQYANIPNALITSDSIYTAFRNYGLPQNNINKKINENDLRQIYEMLELKTSEKKASFGYEPLNEGWNFFHTNTNNGGNFDYQWKVYIPLSDEHYGFAVKNIISFLADNGIVSECKVSGTMRSDSIIVNLTSPSDVTLLNEYIDRNPSLKNCLASHNPFIPDFNGIGVLHGNDINTSFTERLSYYLCTFINTCKQMNRLDCITIDGFYSTLKNSINTGNVQNLQEAEQIIEHLDVILNGFDYVEKNNRQGIHK